METQSLKEVFFENDDYTLEIEKIEKSIGLHCIVRKWTLSSLRHGYSKLGELMNKYSQEGYLHMFTITPNPQFAKLFGGETKYKLNYYDKEYEVVVWDLKSY